MFLIGSFQKIMIHWIILRKIAQNVKIMLFCIITRRFSIENKIFSIKKHVKKNVSYWIISENNDSLDLFKKNCSKC